MNVYAACTLIAKSDMASIVDSLVAPLSVINALVVALCMKRQADVKKTLESMEKLWDEYQVYSNDEINGLDDARPMGGKKGSSAGKRRKHEKSSSNRRRRRRNDDRRACRRRKDRDSSL